MIKKIFLGMLVVVLLAQCLMASELQISNIRALDRGDLAVSPVAVNFDIKWKNSWHNDRNHDAVWVFMKFNGVLNNHVKLVTNGHRIVKTRSGTGASVSIRVSEDSLGLFVHPTANYRGDIDLKLQILLDTSSQEISSRMLRGLTVHGIEMVYIPRGAFTLGSPDREAISRATLYQSDENGQPQGLVTINSEQKIAIAPENGALYYWSEEALYNGDQKGPLPAAFPKGYAAFYIMKYELTQGQYAEFLNTIPNNWTYIRSPIGGRSYYQNRGGIRLVDGEYVADNPYRPMNYVSFTDGLAYTDWAALRPITELEYEKAARGPGKPLPYEFVWGTDNYDLLERYVTADAELTTNNKLDESQLSDDTRAVFGASYYWVMDLSGSLWEKVITLGNPLGRAFKGSHGDGKLDFGNATNEDWPKSDNEIGGFGYRGGGYYEIGTHYSDFNPHSPIGYRYYGAWSGAPRYISYGYRAGRSAIKK